MNDFREERARSAPESYPLSGPQRGLWFYYQLQPSNAFYNLIAHRVIGPLNESVLRRALRSLVERHAALRTTFRAVDGVPRQYVGEAFDLEILKTDLSHLPVEEREPRAVQLGRDAMHMNFDLERGPLARVHLYKLAEDDHILLIVVDHLVSDAWSMNVLERDLGAIYECQLMGRPLELPEISLQHPDFASLCESRMGDEELASQAAYWREQLIDPLPILELPADLPRPPIQTFNGEVHIFKMRSATRDALARLAKSRRATFFVAVLAAYKAWLYRTTGQTDIIVGTPVAGRNLSGVENTIGCFVNTLPIRTQVRGESTIAELMERVRHALYLGFEHSDYAFDDMVAAVNPIRDLSRSPIFQAMLTLYNVPPGDLSLSGCTCSRAPIVNDAAPHDVCAILFADHQTFYVEYNRDVILPESFARMMAQFERVLDSFAEDPDRRVADLPLFSEDERARVMSWSQGSYEPYRDNIGVHALFEDWAARHPDALAVVTPDGQEMSYRELDECSNRLARRLLDIGLRPEQMVGLYLERSPGLIVAIMAVLKAGGVYVPFATEYPKERLLFMIQDSGSNILITDGDQSRALPGFGGEVVSIDDYRNAAGDGSDLSLDIDGRRLAYAIYTSGSTGRPKAVSIEHRGLVSYVTRATPIWDLHRGDRYLQFAPISFDVSAEEIFMALSNGATLVLRSDEMLSIPHLMTHIRELGITHLDLPTAFVHQIVAEMERGLSLPDSVRTVIIGGESFLPERLVSWQAATQGRVRLLNTYGATEATIASTAIDLSHWPVSDNAREVALGAASANERTYLLDESLQPVPVGAYGEIFLGGIGVARGYLDNPSLTADRFIPDPFGPPGSRMYRTGDRARWLTDGNLEFAGRLDMQVKVRGYRIELGEIEAVLRSHPEVDEAVVLLREDGPRTSRLVGYVSSEVEANEPPLADFLQARLPEHMVPSSILRLAEMPLSPSGKIDRRALPPPPKNAEPDGLPQTPTEKSLSEIWKSILGVPEVYRQDDFFRLGGHSLLATQVVSQVADILGVTPPLRVLFERTTLSGLASKIDGWLSGEDGAVVEARASTSSERLSSAQERLWFLEQLHPGTGVYNIPEVFSLEGDLDVAALQRSLHDVVQHHEILRTRIRVDEDSRPTPYLGPADVELRVLDLRSSDDPRADALAATNEEVWEAFDLARDCGLRALLVQTGDRDYILALTAHHIASDGWSQATIMRDLAACYRGHISGHPHELGPARARYAEYAAWQEQEFDGDLLARNIEYFARRMATVTDTLDLPTDRPRPPLWSFDGDHIDLTLDRGDVDRLEEMCRQRRATLYMGMLSVFGTLLHRYTGQQDLVIGSPISDRPSADFDDVVGMFVNTLPIVINLSPSMTFDELLQHVRGEVLDVYAHHVPFERLVERLNPERTSNYLPLFQVTCNYNRTHRAGLELPDIAVARVPVDLAATAFTISLDIEPVGDDWRLTCAYHTDIFDRETVQRMLGHFAALLGHATRHHDRPIGELHMMSDDERRQLLAWHEGPARGVPEKCVHELFAERAARTPDAFALIHGDQVISYAAMEAAANRLAHQLRERGVGPERVVAILAERSPEAIVAFYSVLKAGGAYLSLDPEAPLERLGYIFLDAQPTVCLAQPNLIQRVPRSNTMHVMALEPLDGAPEPVDTPPGSVSAENLAYIVYTSGSSGRPKGVLVPHRGLTNLIVSQISEFGLNPGQRMLQFFSYMFDASVEEIFGSLVAGASLCVVPSAELLPGGPFEATLRRYEPDIISVTPAVLAAMSSADIERDIRIVVGGEACPIDVANRFGAERWLLNAYGPTETTCTATQMRIGPDRRLGIGRPLPNTHACILDTSLALVPVGVPGELCLGGAGVTRGYLGAPGMTAERFIPDPYGEPGSRLYRTGDRARWRDDGNIEFLGRIDEQLKVRGYRIEPGEVEFAICSHRDVLEAVVVADGAGLERRLVAYVRAVTNSVDASTMRAFLRTKLPEYMIPSIFSFVDEIPRTPTGKIHRQALPQVDIEIVASESVIAGPRDRIELVVTRTWEELLQVSPIGPNASFFELGGHSLLAMRMLSEIKRQLDIEVTVSTLFSAPTLEAFARELRDRNVESENSLVPIRSTGSRAPLFLVHPVGGSVMCYVELARHMSDERSIMALQAPGLGAGVPPPPSIPQLASKYLEEVRTIQPEGPYHLGGWSFGGLLAYEMARQLEVGDQAVATLALIDSRRPGASATGDALIEFANDLAANVGAALSVATEELARLTRAEQIQKLHEMAMAAQVLPLGSDSQILARRLAVYEACREAATAYEPTPLDTRVVLFEAQTYPQSGRLAPAWRALLGERLNVISIPGDHYSILERPNVSILATRIESLYSMTTAVPPNLPASSDAGEARPQY